MFSLSSLLGWWPLLEDLIQVASPIIQAHTTGNAQKIAGTVDSVTSVLNQVVNSTNTPKNATAQQIDSAVNTFAPIVEGIVGQFTTSTGHTVTVTAPVK